MTTPFENRQRLYYTREINRGVPTVGGGTPSLPEIAAAVTTDNAGLGPTAASFLSDFGQGTQNVLTADAACRGLVVPSPAMRDPGSRTGCGWWFVADPTRRSTGALGTRRGPMSPTLDSTYGPGTWIWDPVEAEMAERLKRASTIQSCADVVNNGNPEYAWCLASNRAVPVHPTLGTVRYPTRSGGDCGGTLVNVSDGLTACTPPPSNSSAAAAAASSSSALCAGSPLSPACLYSTITGPNSMCTAYGTLATALAGNTYAPADDLFNRTYAIMSRQFTLNEGTYATGNTTQQQALTDVNKLAAFANSGQAGRAVSAARALCYDASGFDPCSYTATDAVSFGTTDDVACIKSYAMNTPSLNYAANAGLFQQPASYWSQFKTWGAVVSNLQWYKYVADNPPGPNNPLNQPASGSVTDIQAAYTIQANAMYDVYGVSIPIVQSSCPPNVT